MAASSVSCVLRKSEGLHALCSFYTKALLDERQESA